MIKITKGNVSRMFKDQYLPNICLELAGGGYTAAQTAKAMVLQNKVLEKGKTKIGKVTLEKIDEDHRSSETSGA